MSEPFDLLSATPAEIGVFVTETLGEPRFRAGQLCDWMRRGIGFDDMSNLSKALRDKLKEQAILLYPEIAEKRESRDGTVKYLHRLTDGEQIESVFMRYHHGNTICVSTQAGCRMGCRFCASTIGGKKRDLLPSEILGQVIVTERDMGERIGGVVLMGIGEPLDNYDNVLRFLHLVSDPAGLNIGLRHISLSTCGIVPNIDRLAQEKLPITLSISLHAPNDAKRSEIMPINQKWGVAELLRATLRYFKTTGRRISFEYTLINGKNDTPEAARELTETFRRYIGHEMPIHVNLIPVNPVTERAFQPSGEGGIRAFADYLSDHGITATVRRHLGGDIDASCGQLRNSQTASSPRGQ